MAWVNNAWLVGIASGLVASGLIWLISRFFLSKRDNREYMQKVSSANRDVIIAIRPGIPEGQIPSAEVLEALVNSTARRYGVVATDLYNSRQTAEELIKEVMDSSFLSSAQKSEYCTRLMPLRVEALQPPLGLAAKPIDTSASLASARTRMVELVSTMLAVSTGLMTTFLAVPELRKQMSGDLQHVRTLEVILIPAVIMSLTVAAFSTIGWWRYSREVDEGVKDAVKKIESVTATIRSTTKQLESASKNVKSATEKTKGV